MKVSFLISFSIFSFSMASAQADSVENKAIQLELTLSILEHCQQLDSRFDYQIKGLLNEEFMQQVGDGGGQLTGYLLAGQLQKAESVFYRDEGLTNRTFYYLENMLVMVKEEVLNYNYNLDEGAWDYTKTIEASSGIYYFQYGQIIQEDLSSIDGYITSANREDQLVNMGLKYQRLLE